MNASPALFLDTNVWLEYCFGDRDHCREARDLIGTAVLKDVTLLTGASSLKDFFYIATRQLKALAVQSGQAIDAQAAASIQEVAWGCTRDILETATVVPLGPGDAWQALVWKRDHPDFEDDLLLASALRCKADYLVTEDKQLARHAPMACLNIGEALGLVSRLA